jgi:hypothetical protein
MKLDGRSFSSQSANDWRLASSSYMNSMPARVCSEIISHQRSIPQPLRAGSLSSANPSEKPTDKPGLNGRGGVSEMPPLPTATGQPSGAVLKSCWI